MGYKGYPVQLRRPACYTERIFLINICWAKQFAELGGNLESMSNKRPNGLWWVIDPLSLHFCPTCPSCPNFSNLSLSCPRQVGRVWRGPREKALNLRCMSSFFSFVFMQEKKCMLSSLQACPPLITYTDSPSYLGVHDKGLFSERGVSLTGVNSLLWIWGRHMTTTGRRSCVCDVDSLWETSTIHSGYYNTSLDNT